MNKARMLSVYAGEPITDDEIRRLFGRGSNHERTSLMAAIIPNIVEVAAILCVRETERYEDAVAAAVVRVSELIRNETINKILTRYPRCIRWAILDHLWELSQPVRVSRRTKRRHEADPKPKPPYQMAVKSEDQLYDFDCISPDSADQLALENEALETYQASLSNLTVRQQKIVALLLKQANNAEIANELGVSLRTVQLEVAYAEERLCRLNGVPYCRGRGIFPNSSSLPLRETPVLPDGLLEGNRAA